MDGSGKWTTARQLARLAHREAPDGAEWSDTPDGMDAIELGDRRVVVGDDGDGWATWTLWTRDGEDGDWEDVQTDSARSGDPDAAGRVAELLGPGGALSGWIVMDGRARRHDPERLPPRGGYGAEWVYVESHSAAEAVARALAWDLAAPGTLVEAELFVAAYRSGAVLLPGDSWVTLADIAERAGVSPATVAAWTQRHPDFPEPMAGGRRAWSDVAAWLAVERRPGRPRREG